MLDAQLAQLEPMSSMIMPDGSGVAPPADQLRALESQLAMLEGRYSPDHPDVVRVRRDVEALRREVGGDVDPRTWPRKSRIARPKLAMARERYSNDHPEVIGLERDIKSLEERAGRRLPPSRPGPARPSRNPTIPPSCRSRRSARRWIPVPSGLHEERAKIQAKIAEYERNMSQTTEVQRQMSALARRLATATANYQSARDRLFAAQMGQSMETQSKGERFTLVEPPDLPLHAVEPEPPGAAGAADHPRAGDRLSAGPRWPSPWTARSTARAPSSACRARRRWRRFRSSRTTMDVTRKRKLRVSVLVVAPIVLAIAAVAGALLLDPS